MSDESTGLVGAAATALPAIKAGIDLFRNAIGLAKEAKELLPDGAKKDVIEKSLAHAVVESKIGEAQIAQALGYKLCQCAFPPPIMLSKGYHPNPCSVLTESRRSWCCPAVITRPRRSRSRHTTTPARPCESTCSFQVSQR